MRVSYYCQHVLGIGHFQRSLQICRAFARKVPTTLILGGPDIETPFPELNSLRLPGLQMDRNFENLRPCDPDLTLDQVKTERSKLLFNHFKHDRPEVFITELYPFGRKAFRFELDPILSAVNTGELGNCMCVCSVRDILVEKETGREKHEKRVLNILNSYYAGILVHSDPEVISLSETFGPVSGIHPPIHYTGFVTAEKSAAPSTSLRKEIGLQPSDTLIVASIGSGSVGGELLTAAVEAVETLSDEISIFLQIFCGPYLPKEYRKQLEQRQSRLVRVRTFSSRFPDWLHAADLSISMAGYNTCMNLVLEGIPAIVYPFGQNREQRMRAERLGNFAPIETLEGKPTGRTLAAVIRRQLQAPRVPPRVNLNGAADSEQQVSAWFHSQTGK
jgi:predicted glycosyltransferase